MKYIQKAIAVDNKLQPLEKAKENLKKYPVNFYLSDGFQDILEDFDLAIICGMGVFTIIKILSKAPNKYKHFLLGPQGQHNKILYLFDWLKKNNFKILSEYNIYDKFQYCFIKVTYEK